MCFTVAKIIDTKDLYNTRRLIIANILIRLAVPTVSYVDVFGMTNNAMALKIIVLHARRG